MKKKEKLADIFAGIGHVFLGSVVLPFAFLDSLHVIVVALGLGTASLFWFLSIYTVKR